MSKRINTSIRISKDLWKNFRKLSQKFERKPSEELEDLIAEYLEEADEDQKTQA